MKNRKNVTWLIIQTVVGAASQFLIYRFIYLSLGAEAMGVWSIASAATTIGIISNLGFANGLIKYIAEALSERKKESAHILVSTANAANFIFSLPLLALLYYPAIIYGASILTAPQFLLFKEVLPWCMATIFFSNLVSVYNCLLDGYQLFFLRSKIQTIFLLLFLILALGIGYYQGLKGIAQAMFIYTFIQFIFLMVLCKKNHYTVTLFPFAMDKASLKKLMHFGANFQIINLLVFFFDPLVKFFITKQYGIGTTAIYELSNKLVVQIRNVVVNINQVITPAIVHHLKGHTAVSYMQRMFRQNLFITLNAVLLIVVICPLAVIFFTGGYNTGMIQAVFILCVGWFFNMISAPLYFAFLGMGKLGWLILQHFLYTFFTWILFNAVSGFSVLSYVVPSMALIIGSIVLLKVPGKLSISWFSLIYKEPLFILFIVAIITGIIGIMYFSMIYLAVLCIITLLVWQSLIWFTPYRAQVAGYLIKKV